MASGGLLAWWPAAEDGLSIRRLRHRAEIRGRERGGLVERVKPRGLAPGTRVRVISGPLCEQIGLLGALRPHERVHVLLQLLGGEQRVDLASNAIEAVE